jgi:hypothetical protein
MWKISFFPASGDEISLHPITAESPSRETAAKVAALLHFRKSNGCGAGRRRILRELQQ